MSTLAERAIAFYLHHSDIVDEVEASHFGSTHQVYSCPECASPVVLREQALVALNVQAGLIAEETLKVSPSSEHLIAAVVP